MAPMRWEDCCSLYQSLSRESCMCEFDPYLLTELRKNLFLAPGDDGIFKEECDLSKLRLLNAEIMKLMTERCILLTSNNKSICQNITISIKHIGESMDELVNFLCVTEDKYLRRTLQKAIALQSFVRYQATQENKLVFIVANAVDEKNSALIPVFEEILKYKVEKQHICQPNLESLLQIFEKKCKRKKENIPINLKEIKYQCCDSLSIHWSNIISRIFSLNENEEVDGCISVIGILQLWKALADEILSMNYEEFFPVFLNSSGINFFFEHWSEIDMFSFKLYIDIIYQISIFMRLKGNGKMFSHEIDKDLFMSFIKETSTKNVVEESNFCTANIEYVGSCSKSMKYDIAVLTKMIALIFCVMSDSVDVPMVLFVLDHTEKVFSKLGSRKNVPLCMNMPKIFLDNDDLLLSMMLSLLDLYLNLELHKRPAECQDIEISLNPHVTFLEFLVQIGKDHNVLLEFFMSDETCILFYMVRYLKLVLADWDSFVFAHEKHHEYENLPNHTHLMNLSEKSAEKSSMLCSGVLDDDQCKIKEAKELDTLHRKLTVYSSSSSEEELFDSDTKCNTGLTFPVEKMDITDTMVVLKELRVAIEKLCDKNEFPYNAKPLLELLRKCEDICKHHAEKHKINS